MSQIDIAVENQVKSLQASIYYLQALDDQFKIFVNIKIMGSSEADLICGNRSNICDVIKQTESELFKDTAKQS